MPPRPSARPSPSESPSDDERKPKAGRGVSQDSRPEITASSVHDDPYDLGYKLVYEVKALKPEISHSGQPSLSEASLAPEETQKASEIILEGRSTPRGKGKHRQYRYPALDAGNPTRSPTTSMAKGQDVLSQLQYKPDELEDVAEIAGVAKNHSSNLEGILRDIRSSLDLAVSMVEKMSADKTQTNKRYDTVQKSVRSLKQSEMLSHDELKSVSVVDDGVYELYLMSLDHTIRSERCLSGLIKIKETLYGKKDEGEQSRVDEEAEEE